MNQSSMLLKTEVVPDSVPAEAVSVGASNDLTLSRDKSRLFSLDVLRGLAIALVLIHHFPPTGIREDRLLERFVDFWVSVGWVGVDLFFVLSGFLISGLIFKEYDRTGGFNAKRFWIRRGYKIWPAYFAAYGGMTLARITWEVIRGERERAVELLVSAGCNGIFLQNYLSCERWSHSWSLAVEEHFYTAFAILAGLACWFGAKKAWDGARAFRFIVPMFFAVAIMALYLRWRLGFPEYVEEGRIAYYQSHLRIDSLLFGVLLSYLLRYKRSSFPKILLRWPFVVSTLIAALAWPAFLPIGETPYSEFIGLTLIYLSFGLAVASAGVNPQFGLGAPKAISQVLRCLAWLGVYSYTIYLAHAILFGLPGAETLRQLGLGIVSSGLGDAFALWLDRTGFLALSILGGVTLSHAIERPFLRLRERLLP